MIEAMAVINTRREEIIRELDNLRMVQDKQGKLGLKPIKKLDEVYDELTDRLIKLTQARQILFDYMLKDDPVIKD